MKGRVYQELKKAKVHCLLQLISYDILPQPSKDFNLNISGNDSGRQTVLTLLKEGIKKAPRHLTESNKQ